jgi:hypothetical protein
MVVSVVTTVLVLLVVILLAVASASMISTRTTRCHMLPENDLIIIGAWPADNGEPLNNSPQSQRTSASLRKKGEEGEEGKGQVLVLTLL